MALADARGLVEVKTGCCRCCYGEGHKYQRTLGEYNHDRDQWLAKGKELAEFEDQGGIGFNPQLPHPECPNCGGDGDARVVLKDTRTLSPQALALYAGAKTGKYGIEVQMHSKMDALEKLAKHVGLYEKDNTQKNDPLALRNMTDAERAVRMSSLLQANPALVTTLAQLMLLQVHSNEAGRAHHRGSAESIQGLDARDARGGGPPFLMTANPAIWILRGAPIRGIPLACRHRVLRRFGWRWAKPTCCWA